MTALIACAISLSVSLTGVGVAVWVWRRSVDERHRKEDAAEKSVEVKEWTYLDQGAVVIGPLENTIMSRMFDEGVITRETKAKLVFVEEDFKPIGELFPQPGTEFKRAATIDRQKSLNGDWHRFSTLAKPGGVPLPSISWRYRVDDEIHGPFETAKMRHWFMEGYFNASSPVRMEGHGADFYTLGEYYPKISDAFHVSPKVLSHMARSSLVRQENVTTSVERIRFSKPQETDHEQERQASHRLRENAEADKDNMVQPLLSSIQERKKQSAAEHVQGLNLQEQPPTVDPKAAVIGRSADEQPANSEQASAPKSEAKAPGEEGRIKKKREKKAKENGEPKKEKRIKKKVTLVDEVTLLTGSNEVCAAYRRSN